MTYKDRFVVEVKTDGQILRVRDGAVYLPFGCEYSILLKNLNSKKASVKISIDGEDVLDGQSLIIPALVTHELNGYLKGTTAKNRFRFIQKTKKIQEHRGDRVGDGLLRVEFAFEKDKPEPRISKIIKEIHHHHHRDVYYGLPNYTVYNSNDDWNPNDTLYSSTAEKSVGGNSNSSINCSYNAEEALRGVPRSAVYTVQELGVAGNLNTPLNDEGITVKGNEIEEQYQYSSIGELEDSSVIVIELRGVHQSHGVHVQAPITVSTKLTCSSCGTRSKSSFKFCPECGTYLE